MKDRQFTWGPQQQQAFQTVRIGCVTPFILTTEASKLTIAANVSNVQDRKERPIACASIQLNTAEQNCNFRTGNVCLGVGNQVLPLLNVWKAFPS